MIDFKTFFNRRYSYTKSDLKRIALEGQQVILDYFGSDHRGGSCYYNNVIETAFYADSSVSYDELDFFNSTAEYKTIDKEELYRISRQAWDVCEYYDTIPNNLRSKGPDVYNAVIVISLAACLCDGSLSSGEISYINKLVGYKLI